MTISLPRVLLLIVMLSGGMGILLGQEFGGAPSGLALEMTTVDGLPRSKSSLFTERNSGFWTSNLPRVQGWKLPDGADAIQVVHVTARLVGGKVNVKVSVFRGKRFGEKEELVAEMTLGLGESRSVTELRNYGFEPVSFGLVATDLAVATLPVVINPSPKVQVSVTTLAATLPAFQATWVNDSDKPVQAICWHTEADGRTQLSSLPRGMRGETLIEPGGRYTLNIDVHGVSGQRLVVDSVVFKDGSFDGSKTNADEYFRFIAGDKPSLSIIVPILRSAADRGTVSLKDLIQSIDTATFAAVSKPQSGRPAPPDRVTTGLLKELRALESAAMSEDETRLRLLEIAQNYGEWFDRLVK